MMNPTLELAAFFFIAIVAFFAVIAGIDLIIMGLEPWKEKE